MRKTLYATLFTLALVIAVFHPALASSNDLVNRPPTPEITAPPTDIPPTDIPPTETSEPTPSSAPTETPIITPFSEPTPTDEITPTPTEPNQPEVTPTMENPDNPTSPTPTLQTTLPKTGRGGMPIHVKLGLLMIATVALSFVIFLARRARNA